MRDELIAQLEFFRDIGVETLDLEALRATAMPRSLTPPPAAAAVSISTPAPAAVRLTLDDVRADLGDCQRCKLAPTRRTIVFGSGSPNAELMFIGEGPGADEDAQGLPFVGRAGQLLTKIIESIDLKREEVYIANVVKCRPPENRNPEPDEIAACSPFLRQQIKAVNPKILCCLGTFAAQVVLRNMTSISKLRGSFHDVDGVRAIATFHPAYLLRSPDKKRDVWEDMKMIRAELQRLRGG